MAQYHRHGSPQQYHIQPDAPVVDVPAVHLDSFGIVYIASAAGLPHAGDAGKNGIVFFNVFVVSFHFRLHDRPWPYEAHFPFQHVPELGKFVEAGLSKEGAALCNAGIVFQFEFFIPFRFGRRVGSQEVLQHFFRVYAHGPELVAVEFFPVLPYSPVFEDHRARGVVVDPEGDGEEEGRDEEAADDGGSDVEDPLQEAVPGVVEIIPDVENHDLRVEEGFHRHVGHGDGYEIRYHRHVLDQGLGAVDEVGKLILREAGGSDEDGVYPRFLRRLLEIIEAAEDGHVGTVVFEGLPVFQESQNPVPHAGVPADLVDNEVSGLPGAYNEHGDLESPDLLEYFTDEDTDDRKESKGQGCEEQHKEPGHLSRHLGDEHEEHGEHGAPEAGEEDALRHLVHQHPFPVEPFEEEEQHKHQWQPEEEVGRRQVEGAVGHDPVPEVHGKEPRHHQGEVVKERKNNSR